MPVGAIPTAGQQVFQLLRRIREELGVNTTGGASNVSFGMPNRQAINAHFLSMAIAHGLTSAITNPLEESLRQAIMAADLLMGHDENAMAWIRANRKPASGGWRERSPSSPPKGVELRAAHPAYYPVQAETEIGDRLQGSFY